MGYWINAQRERKRGIRSYSLDDEKVEKLNQIGCCGDFAACASGNRIIYRLNKSLTAPAKEADAVIFIFIYSL